MYSISVSQYGIFWEKTIIPMPSIWDILIERRVILVIFQEVNVWATSRLAIFGEKAGLIQKAA